MELKITGTNTILSPDIHRRIEDKFGKLNKHMPDISDVKVEISEEKTKAPEAHYLVKATVTSRMGRNNFHGEERAVDLYQAIDKTAQILTRQLEKHKGKLYERGRSDKQVRGKFPEPEIVITKRVVKTKHFIIEPMTVEEAIAAMEKLGHNFFLFQDARANEARLLYRRNDGDYGLIEPEFK